MGPEARRDGRGVSGEAAEAELSITTYNNFGLQICENSKYNHDELLDVVGGDAAAGEVLAADPAAAPVSPPGDGAVAAPESPDPDPIGDLALERAHALSPVAVVVGAGAAAVDEAGGRKREEESNDER